MMSLSALEVVQDVLGHLRKFRFVTKKLIADAVNLECVLVAVALRIQIEMEVIAGQLAVQQFHAADLDDAVATVCRQTRWVSVSRTI
jgi:hypothetical protein